MIDMGRQRCRLLATLLATLALAWQSLAVQTHLHHGAFVGDRAVVASQTATEHGHARHVAVDDCALCAAALQADHFLHPVTFEWAARTVLHVAPSLVEPTDVLPVSHSHGWRSRAPPAGGTPSA